MRRALPSIVTGLGLLCGLVGISIYPRPLALALLVASLLLDVADGWLARQLGACTARGASFDWHTDVALAHLGCVLLGWSPTGNAALVLHQAFVTGRHPSGIRTSGRAPVFVALLIAAFLR